MTRGNCSYCRREADKRELKRCSGCQYLLYCSKECQTLSWKTTHKYNCRRRDVLYSGGDTRSAKEEKSLTSWLNTWKISLDTTAVAALDLANHESGYLLNHCLHIQLKRTGHKTDAKRFTIDEIGVSRVDLLRKDYPGIASILADPPELVGKRVRYIAVVRDHQGRIEQVRGCVYTHGNIEAYCNMSREYSEAIATALMTKLVSAVGAGDIGAIPGMMKAEEC